ncbi:MULTISPECIES: F0F1 ATP synthase subunit epsilon [Stutzerimonas]|jgi:F-type H+-transporting ATPase subunit epsilon|uniref:ATP synthase epsilon chain n=1 Tax=Stutzerimonas balearica TaxID=74829 RepID=A0A9X7YRW7_9GAMM|nr:F0F1 ATP synthase subunit epsilon [Stutzerimonas balearica]MBB63067.1 F0F1 ATP synthase subunit epsilon [Pseudomonas sp.]MBZ5757588.1 F0F1 ATP synthase subunit epsilon [Pseudomonas sp. S5(2021)]MBC7201080.1 F0F1 ATP synthase subunit epsilon [Stutzerimonas balearica]MBK3749259.1 F0F1 ATP synthase subunit epsilon [Stutzerimonas balearica]MBK3827456.1 F0F1 ATP synthase subunit epsilon [Stutzerimonas balearica]
MTAPLHLLLTTPQRVLIDAEVVALRAEDASGAFGILPGHTDLLTVLVPTVLRWRLADGSRHYCAVSGGVLSLSAGELRIACREAVLGERLDTLQAEVDSEREARRERMRQARVEHLQLHTRAVRQLVRYLRAGEPTPFTEDGGQS